MTDPVEVLARSKCCLGPCELPRACDKRLWERAARHDIAVLESARLKIVSRDATQPMADAGWGAIANTASDPQSAAWPIWSAMWDAAPTYGDKS